MNNLHQLFILLSFVSSTVCVCSSPQKKATTQISTLRFLTKVNHQINRDDVAFALFSEDQQTNSFKPTAQGHPVSPMRKKMCDFHPISPNKDDIDAFACDHGISPTPSPETKDN